MNITLEKVCYIACNLKKKTEFVNKYFLFYHLLTYGENKRKSYLFKVFVTFNKDRRK